MPTFICPVCQTQFQRPRAWTINKGILDPVCSRQCNGTLRGAEWAKHGYKGRAAWTEASRATYREKMSGEQNPAWKGGVTYFRKHGNYKPIKYVRAPSELLPMARKDGYVMEHRATMARMAGYLLTRVEVVHHRNHDPQDNTPSNLELWPDNLTHKTAEHGRCVTGAACRWSLRALAPL
jgi:hypothetical protein